MFSYFESKIGEMKVFSSGGQAKLSQLSKEIDVQIKILESSLPQLSSSASSSSSSFSFSFGASFDEIGQKTEALLILRKIKALLDKLPNLDMKTLQELAEVSPDFVDSEKEIEDMTTRELVRDLLVNRDIYWDVKNKFLHTSLAGLFKVLKELGVSDFSFAAMTALQALGGVDKIHAVGIILSSLLPFYEITQSRAGVSNSQYHPDVDGRLWFEFREKLYPLHDGFLAKIKEVNADEEKWELLNQYKAQYNQQVRAFLQIVHTLPGETIFLEAHNRAFNPDSVVAFRPQGGILRGLLQVESSLNIDLAKQCPELLTEPLLTTAYDDVASSLNPEAIYEPRKKLFAMVEAAIIQPFQSYIDANGGESGLTKAKADLLQYFLTDFIYGKASIQGKTAKGTEVFMNKDGAWRTADNFARGQFYTCAEIATKLLAELIAILKQHDHLCKQANKGVGRTGLLLASAIEATAKYLRIPYDHRVDDVFLSTLASYKEQLSPSFGPQDSSPAQPSGMSVRGRF